MVCKSEPHWLTSDDISFRQTGVRIESMDDGVVTVGDVEFSGTPADADMWKEYVRNNRVNHSGINKAAFVIWPE